MGILIGPEGQQIELPASLTIGRNPSCDLVLSARDVSSWHAQLSWTERGWVVRDGSSNGTFIDGRRIEAGVDEKLKTKMTVQFASSRWVLGSDRPPPPMAREVRSGELVVGQKDVLNLPDADDAQACVAYTLSGWQLERAGEPGAVEAKHDQIVSVDGRRWLLLLPIEPVHTVDSVRLPLVEELTLRLAHSQDHEHLRVSVIYQEREIALKSRAHHHTLFVLAEARRHDQADGMQEAEAGWRSRCELVRMADVSRNTLDQHIFRARQELSALGLVPDGGSLILSEGDRVRIGISDLHIQSL
ncbi:MAG: hypothetical protein ACI8S6_002395 [Myxococcota bacterium]